MQSKRYECYKFGDIVRHHNTGEYFKVIEPAPGKVCAPDDTFTARRIKDFDPHATKGRAVRLKAKNVARWWV